MRRTQSPPSPTLDPDQQPFWSRIAQPALLLLIILASLGITTTAAALALGRSNIDVLDTETASQLKADYSADPRGIRIAPLDAAIIEAAAEDERELSTTPQLPQRIEIVHPPPPASSDESIFVDPKEVVESTATPLPSTTTPLPLTATPLPSTTTPLLPTATPLPPTATPLPSTATPLPPTATPLPPTATPLPSTATPLPSTATPLPGRQHRRLPAYPATQSRGSSSSPHSTRRTRAQTSDPCRGRGYGRRSRGRRCVRNRAVGGGRRQRGAGGVRQRDSRERDR